MAGVKPLRRGPLPKYKEGQWIFYANFKSGHSDHVVIECSIQVIQITKIVDHYTCHDYRSGNWYLTKSYMFDSFDDAVEYMKQEIKKKRLKVLIEKGCVV